MNDITLLTNKFIKEVYNISKLNNYKIKCNKEILEELSKFEIKMKVLMGGYSNKIEQLGNYSKKEEIDMLKFAEELQADYKYISILCNEYIQNLQIID